MHPSIHPSTYPSVHSSIHASIHLPVHPFTSSSIHLFIHPPVSSQPKKYQFSQQLANKFLQFLYLSSHICRLGEKGGALYPNRPLSIIQAKNLDRHQREHWISMIVQNAVRMTIQEKSTASGNGRKNHASCTCLYFLSQVLYWMVTQKKKNICRTLQRKHFPTILMVMVMY